jgi:hypothetical protein
MSVRNSIGPAHPFRKTLIYQLPKSKRAQILSFLNAHLAVSATARDRRQRRRGPSAKASKIAPAKMSGGEEMLQVAT